mmetsp:Transcript_12878/g.36744  ORF Transcript_12878/g.36744 Transcript_12878/m.36744 type:complete len:273 (-) Transcript_12878:921-1739(-)
MSDAEAVAATTETAIGEQCNTIAKTSSHDGTCRRQHFRQSRPPRRTFVTDNDNVAALNLLVLQSSEHRLFVVIHLGRTRKGLSLLASNLSNASTGTKITVHNLQMAGLLDRIVKGTNDFLPRREARMVHLGKILIVSLTRHSHLVAVEHAIVDEELDHTGRTTNVLNVLHHKLAGRLEVSEEGGLVRNALEIVESDGDRRILTATRHGDEMKDCVRRASGHHDHGDGILKRSLGHDIAGLDILLEKNLHRLTRPSAFVAFLLGISRSRGGIG